jgi:hypothetical protein
MAEKENIVVQTEQIIQTVKFQPQLDELHQDPDPQ